MYRISIIHYPLSGQSLPFFRRSIHIYATVLPHLSKREPPAVDLAGGLSGCLSIKAALWMIYASLGLDFDP